jgi:hypothetical protein
MARVRGRNHVSTAQSRVYFTEFLQEARCRCEDGVEATGAELKRLADHRRAVEALHRVPSAPTTEGQ